MNEDFDILLDDDEQSLISSTVDWNEVGDAVLSDFEGDDFFNECCHHNHENSQETAPKCANLAASLKISEYDTLKSYAKSIERAINSQDFNDMESVLSNCTTTDLTTVLHYPKGNPHGYSFRQIDGQCTSIRYLHSTFSTVPDALFLIHSTEIHTDKNTGFKTITSKFTCNGTKLFTVSAEQHGCKLPEAPAVTLLHKHIHKNVSSRTSEVVYSSLGSIALKKSENVNKFDRYKPQKGSTLGAHMEYNNFSESSMQSRKKKHSDIIAADQQTDHNEEQSNHTIGINNHTCMLDNSHSISHSHSHNSNNSSSENVMLRRVRSRSDGYDSTGSNYSNSSNGSHNSNGNMCTADGSNSNDCWDHHGCQHNNSCGAAASNNVSINNNPNYSQSNNHNHNCRHNNNVVDPHVVRVTATVSELRNKYLQSERFYADSHTHFSLSPLLAIPLPYDSFGVLKMMVNSDNRICMLEFMYSAKSL